MEIFFKACLIVIFSLYRANGSVVELFDEPFEKLPDNWKKRPDIFNSPAEILNMLKKSKVEGTVVPVVNRTGSPVILSMTEKGDDQIEIAPYCLEIAAGKYKDFSIPLVKDIKSISVNSGFLNLMQKAKGGVCLTVETEQPLVFPKVLKQFNFIPDLKAAKIKVQEFLATDIEAKKIEAKKIQEYINHVGYLRWCMADGEWILDENKKKEFAKDGIYLPLYQQRQDLYEKFNIKSLSNEELSYPRIPQNLFSIWLTNPLKPTEPKEEYIDLILRSEATNSAKNGWHQYLVVQEFVLKNPDLFKITRKKLAGSAVQLTSYERLTGRLELQNQFDEIVNKSKFAKASDLLRVEILNKLGGAYLDIDLLVLHSLKPLFYLYDSLFGIEPMSEFVGNAFMASSAGHPIMRESLNLIDRNLKFKDEGKNFYSSSVQDDNDGFNTILQTGPCVTTVAFFNQAGVGGNRDILMPPEMFYPAGSLERPEFRIPNIGDPVGLGAATLHLWRTTWAGPEGDKNGCKG